MDSATISVPPRETRSAGAAAGEKGLKSGALGHVSNLVIAVASVGPAYSLAATLGFIVAVKGVGTSSPAVLLVSFIPMLFIAAAYYGLTGFACAVYYRRELLKSAPNFVFLGLAPSLGGLMLLAIFIKAMIFYGHRANNYSPDAFGIGLPVFIGIAGLVLGVVAMITANLRPPGFFRRRREVADPAMLAGHGQ
jgi:hypothetical protein